MWGYPWGQIGYAVLRGVAWFFCNPLLYISLLLFLWDKSRAVKNERRFFGARVSRVLKPLYVYLLFGLLLGVVLSLAGLVAGDSLTAWDILAFSVVSIVLGLFRLRLLAAPYAIGLFTVVTVVARSYPGLFNHMPTQIQTVWTQLAVTPAADWLVLGAGVSLAELLLFLFRIKLAASPALVLGRRGRPIGGYLLQMACVIPWFPITKGTVSLSSVVPQWWPWIAGGHAGVQSWTLLCVPLVTGFSGLVSTEVPKARLRRLMRVDAIAFVIACGGVYASVAFTEWAAFAAGLILIAAREGMTWLNVRLESTSEAMYSPSTEGVRILEVQRGSLAEQMGLLPGEVITHVNQVPVHTPYDLHFAFDQNPAYAKVQVLDANHEIRMTGKPVYEGQRHHLGLVLIPDSVALTSYRARPGGLFQTLYLRRHESVVVRADLEAAPTIES